MIRLLVWLILSALVIRSIVRLARGIAEGLQGPPAPRTAKAVPLVRDPVCGTHIVPSAALRTGEGAQAKFFCSEDCRRAYVSSTSAGGEHGRAARWGSLGGAAERSRK